MVCDNLNTHLSTRVVRAVARLCGIESDLSEKRKSGVLTSEITRQTFLCDRVHRICVHFTPKHASWLNQIEVWFSIFGSQAAKSRNPHFHTEPRGANRTLHLLL
jgi:hypothetical protein